METGNAYMEPITLARNHPKMNKWVVSTSLTMNKCVILTSFYRQLYFITFDTFFWGWSLQSYK